PPPTSARFPSPTLFRSREIIGYRSAEVVALTERAAGVAHRLDLFDRLEAFGDNVHVQRRSHFGHRADDRVTLLADVGAGDEAAVDRKSTRLNSSHVKIS